MNESVISNEELKESVRNRYAEIAKTRSSCCSATKSGSSTFSDDYSELDGYVADADLNLGCGVPTEFAKISVGDHVLDLGAGAGNDVFVSRRIVGEAGKVVGLDMTQEMIDRANENKTKLGYENVEFVLGEIEDMPLEDSSFNVVISNCVLNLVPDKIKAYEEVYRVLKPEGHFCMSDVVLIENLPEKVQKAAELYSSCVAGALLKETYISAIEAAGFKEVEVLKEKEIRVSDETLGKALSPEEIEEYRKQPSPVVSITVFGQK
ncbi:MAG: arsenite methyltransferase [Bacteroidota bacterium]